MFNQTRTRMIWRQPCLKQWQWPSPNSNISMAIVSTFHSTVNQVSPLLSTLSFSRLKNVRNWAWQLVKRLLPNTRKKRQSWGLKKTHFTSITRIWKTILKNKNLTFYSKIKNWFIERPNSFNKCSGSTKQLLLQSHAANRWSGRSLNTYARLWSGICFGRSATRCSK